MLNLIIEFMKAGLFAIGGGLATIPFLIEIGEKYNYFTHNEFLTMIAVSESTPGAIGINMATFAGLKAYGILGGIIATISIVFPSIIIIIEIAKLIDIYRKSPYTKRVLDTLKTISIGFIMAAIFPIFKSLIVGEDTIWVILTAFIFGVVFFIREKWGKIHPGLIILSSFIIGIIISYF